MYENISTPKKVCVIGTGLSGLVTIKELLSQGIQVKCYEAQTGIGGAFRDVGEGGRSYDSIELTVSNFFMAFSDYPPGLSEKRRYWTAREYRNYLHRYAKHFHLLPHIFLSHEVVSAEIHQGRVMVKVAGPSQEFSEFFDHLVICSGNNFLPKYPEYARDPIFKGEILHSSQYKNAEPFKGKKVLCIGMGESGADTVHEISQVASCYVLVRDKPNVVPRWINHFTNDSYTTYCFYEMGKNGLDRFMKFKAWYYLNFDTKLSKEERLIQQWIYDRNSFIGKFLTKNDIFIEDIVSGRLQFLEGEVKRLLPDGIITDKDEKVEADVLLFNTGYRTCFRQFRFGKDFSNPRHLFKHMLHPEYQTLVSLVGWARPTQGGVPACSEMQARYLALLITGKKALPEKSVMYHAIQKDKQYAEYYFSDSKNIESLVNYHDFMPDMAKLIGCKTKFFYPENLLLTFKMYFGSHLPAFYRLTDPNPEIRRKSIEVIQSLPIAYSLRRVAAILFFTILFRVPELLGLYIKKALYPFLFSTERHELEMGRKYLPRKTGNQKNKDTEKKALPTSTDITFLNVRKSQE